jgi:uncharacterized protein (TIGR00730 family)
MVLGFPIAAPVGPIGAGPAAHADLRRTGYHSRSTATARRDPVLEEVPLTKPNAPPSAADGPPLAYRDHEFLDSDEGRPLRILSEYLQPLRAFRQQRVHDTIVFFGSARLREDGPMASSYAAARELARLVTEWSKQLGTHADRFMVCSGGGGGIMEAANRGAADAGGRTIGLNIGLPHEQRPNPYITRGLCFEFHYFFMRKLWFAHLARAIVAFPGGFGTLDELFEILTLSQTGKLDRRVIVILYGSSYWNEIVNFKALVRHGMISAEDLALFHVVDSPAEALEVLQRGLATEMAPVTPAIAKSVTCHCEP